MAYEPRRLDSQRGQEMATVMAIGQCFDCKEHDIHVDNCSICHENICEDCPMFDCRICGVLCCDDCSVWSDELDGAICIRCNLKEEGYGKSYQGG